MRPELILAAWLGVALAGEPAPVDGGCVIPDGCEVACDGGDGAACERLARAFRAGAGVPGDQNRAITLDTRACELGRGASCRELGDAYTVGIGTAPDSQTAGLWYQQGCEKGDGTSCASAALWLERGDLFDADPERARALLDRGCATLGSGRACAVLGMRLTRGLEGATRDPDGGADLFARACELGDPEGCRLLGEAWYAGRGRPESPSEGLRAMQRACELSDSAACVAVMQRAMIDRDWRTAAAAGKRACALGLPKACPVGERAARRLAVEQGQSR